MTHLLFLSNVSMFKDICNIYRYSNVYCAICNDVKDIRYWRVGVGCIHVANDKCNYAPGSFSEEILFLSNNIFRKNPNVTELKHSK